MVTTSVTSKLTLLLSRLNRHRGKIEEINHTSEALGLPPAIDLNFEGDIQIGTNPDYRFEGFGIVFGLPPMMSFYVHYKPESPEHVELGRFLMPIRFGDLATLVF